MASSVLWSKHFEQDCFIVEGICYHENMGIPTKKRHKPNAIPIKFTRPTHGESGRPTPLCKRTAYEKYTTELHGPEPVHEPPTKPDMHHKGMMHDHLCIFYIHYN